MPYPNWHSARILNPGLFVKDTFRNKTITQGVEVILGKRTPDGSMEVQAYRFAVDKYTVAEAQAWLKEQKITWFKFEPAEAEAVKAFIALQCFKTELGTADILAMIEPATLAAIRAKDAHPFFQAYSICHEGTSCPTVIGDTARPIHWTRRAIQSIKNVLTKGIKFFFRHNSDNSTENRKELGEVVADAQREIDGRLHHVVIGYFPDKEAVQAFDVCSQEADWNLIDEAGKWIADKIEKLTGIALSKSTIDKPAFDGAVRLGMVQAFSLQGGGPGSGRKPSGSGSVVKSKLKVDKIGNVESEDGYISATIDSDSTFDDEGNEISGEKYIRIDLVYTNPEARGKGKAEEMMNASLDSAEKTGMPIKLIAMPKEKTVDSDKLVSFYERMGFDTADEQGGAGVLMEYQGKSVREKRQAAYKKKIQSHQQAFETGTDDGGKPDDQNILPGKGKEIIMTKDEVIKAVRELNLHPAQIFTLDDLRGDRVFGKIVDENESLKAAVKEKDDAIAAAKSESEKTAKQMLTLTAATRMKKMIADGQIKLTEKQKAFIEKRFTGEIADTSDDGIKKYIESELDTFRVAMETAGVKEDVPSVTSPVPDTTDMTKAVNNPLLDADFDMEM